jgi:hypothetical protein
MHMNEYVRKRQIGSNLMNLSTFQVPREALEQLSRAPQSAVLLYLRICSLEEGPGEPTTLSSAKLAAMTGMTQRTVFGAVAQLEKLGLIGREKTMSTGVNRYRVSVSDDRVVSAAPPDGVADCITRGSTKSDDAQLDAAISVGPSSAALEYDGVSRSESKAVPLDDLIATVYSAKCQVGDIQSLVDVNEVELRMCLEWLHSEGGVVADMPVGFFAGAIKMAIEKLTPHRPPWPLQRARRPPRAHICPRKGPRRIIADDTEAPPRTVFGSDCANPPTWWAKHRINGKRERLVSRILPTCSESVRSYVEGFQAEQATEKASKTSNRIRVYLTEHGAGSPAQIAAGIGVVRNTASRLANEWQRRRS